MQQVTRDNSTGVRAGSNPNRINSFVFKPNQVIRLYTHAVIPVFPAILCTTIGAHIRAVGDK